jgi:hypothetical protein
MPAQRATGDTSCRQRAVLAVEELHQHRSVRLRFHRVPLCAMALSFDHIGNNRITTTMGAGTPTSFMNGLIASLWRPALTASLIRAQSSRACGRLPSTMNGASYNASFLIPARRFAAARDRRGRKRSRCRPSSARSLRGCVAFLVSRCFVVGPLHFRRMITGKIAANANADFLARSARH